MSVHSWDKLNGTLVINLLPGTRIVANVQHTLEFDLKNTAKGQDAVTVTMSGRRAAYMSPVVASNPYSFAAPLRVYGVKAATIMQSTSQVVQLNTLTIRLSLHTLLPQTSAGALIVVISGLTGSASPSSVRQKVSQVRQPLDTPMEDEAAFDSRLGKLYLTIYTPSAAEIQAVYKSQDNTDPDSPRATFEYVFSVDLRNGALGHKSPQTSIETLSGVCPGPWLSPYTITSGPGYLAPLMVADFQRVSMNQSTAAVAALNFVTLSFDTAGFIPAGTRMTVKGLYCVRCGNVPDQVLSCMSALCLPPFCLRCGAYVFSGFLHYFLPPVHNSTALSPLLLILLHASASPLTHCNAHTHPPTHACKHILQCTLVVRAVTANQNSIWDETNSTSISPVIFSNTATRVSSYPIDTFTLVIQQDLPSSSLIFTFSLRNTDCGQDASPFVELSVEPPWPSTPAANILILPKVPLRPCA